MKLISKNHNNILRMTLRKAAFLFFVFYSILLHSQKHIDSLKNKNFDELKVMFFNSLDDISLARDIASFTLELAKEKNNTRAISNSYIRIYGTYFADYEIGRVYLDSSIANSKKFKHNDLLAEAYFLRGNILYSIGDDEKASEDFLNAKKFVTDNKKLYYRIIYNIGILKLDLGKNQEALEIFKECYNIELNNNKSDFVNYDYLETLYGLSIVYTNLKLNDSASKYAQIGYELSKPFNDSSHLKFTYSEGNNQFSKGNYNASKDSLYKSLGYLKKIGDLQNLAITYFYLGSIYKIQGVENKMVDYFKKVDSIFDKADYIYPETRLSYEFLIKFYEKKNDLKKQLFYIKRLLAVDSTLHKRYTNINDNIYVKFDRINLIQEKKRIENKFKESKRNFLFKNIIYIILILVFSILFIFYYRRNIIFKRKFEELMKTDKEIDDNLNLNTENKKNNLPDIIEKKEKLNLDENLINNVLEKLRGFEESYGFLEKGLTVRLLSEKCNTNSKYMSIIINKHKNKTFRNYINHLRIDYAVDKIKTDPIFRDYTISGIADKVGFSNSESYAKAFHKKTGIHTSYFVKKIKSIENQSTNN